MVATSMLTPRSTAVLPRALPNKSWAGLEFCLSPRFVQLAALDLSYRRKHISCYFLYYGGSSSMFSHMSLDCTISR